MPTTSRPLIRPVDLVDRLAQRGGGASAARACGSAAAPASVSRAARAERSISGAPRSRSSSPHLRADPGLADVHALRGAGEVRLLGDRDQVLKLPQFHNQ